MKWFWKYLARKVTPYIPDFHKCDFAPGSDIASRMLVVDLGNGDGTFTPTELIKLKQFVADPGSNVIRTGSHRVLRYESHKTTFGGLA